MDQQVKHWMRQRADLRKRTDALTELIWGEMGFDPEEQCGESSGCPHKYGQFDKTHECPHEWCPHKILKETL